MVEDTQGNEVLPVSAGTRREPWCLTLKLIVLQADPLGIPARETGEMALSSVKTSLSCMSERSRHLTLLSVVFR